VTFTSKRSVSVETGSRPTDVCGDLAFVVVLTHSTGIVDTVPCVTFARKRPVGVLADTVGAQALEMGAFVDASATCLTSGGTAGSCLAEHFVLV
jgi:hypothetical protein